MNLVVAFFLAVINSMLIQNVVLYRFYGICPFLGVSKKSDEAFSMGLAVTFVIVIASATTWPIYTYLLKPSGLEFLDTITYILVIASLVQLIEMFIKKYSPKLYTTLGVYLPLITTNCAVLGVAQGNTDSGLNFGMSMANAIGTSLGFMLIIFAFSCIRVRLEANKNVPEAFKGVPIALITAAIMSMAFVGLGGLIK